MVILREVNVRNEYSKDTKNHSHEEVDTLIILHGKLYIQIYHYYDPI